MQQIDEERNGGTAICIVKGVVIFRLRKKVWYRVWYRCFRIIRYFSITFFTALAGSMDILLLVVLLLLLRLDVE